MVVGILVAGCYMYVGSRNVNIQSEIIEETAQSLSETNTLSSLSPEQQKRISVDDMEKYFLSDKNIDTVDEVLTLYDEYIENIEDYTSNKDVLELSERAEAFNYIVNTRYIIEIRVGLLTADEQIYYYAKRGLSSVVGEDNTLPVNNEDNNNTGVSKKKAILLIIVFIAIHIFSSIFSYLISKKVRHGDSIDSLLGVQEYTRVIDWDKVDGKCVIDKLINRLRFSKYRRMGIEEVLEINALTAVGKMRSKKYNNVAVVGTSLDEDRDLFATYISKNDDSLSVKSIDSTLYSVTGADEIMDVVSAILVVRVGVTIYNDLINELKSLQDRNIDIIGIIVFE